MPELKCNTIPDRVCTVDVYAEYSIYRHAIIQEISGKHRSSGVTITLYVSGQVGSFNSELKLLSYQIDKHRWLDPPTNHLGYIIDTRLTDLEKIEIGTILIQDAAEKLGKGKPISESDVATLINDCLPDAD